MPEGWKESRAQLYAANGVDLGLPEIEFCHELIELVSVDLGWIEADGMGNLRPISWAEIEAAARQLDLGLEPWEARQVRRMSEAYIQGFTRGGKAMVSAPAYPDRGDDPGLDLERRLVSEKIKEGMKGISRS